jgi:hypothetical protein
LKGHGFTARGKTRRLHLILGGAAVYRCDNRLALNAALQAVEKLDVALDFGWRSGSPLR